MLAIGMLIATILSTQWPIELPPRYFRGSSDSIGNSATITTSATNLSPTYEAFAEIARVRPHSIFRLGNSVTYQTLPSGL